MLICKKCGYKQSDEETIAVFKERFLGQEEWDIPYYCGACLDNADDDEFEKMELEMEGEKRRS